ncbi:MAG: cupin domain-containing protein [Alphaproteobacteria bacterium]|nr:cupin domain-containing protein [Alphaproteobacteria bacterium]
MHILLFVALVTCGLPLGLAVAEPAIIGELDGQDVVTVRGVELGKGKQDLPFFPGISGKTAGAEGLSLSMVVIPPGSSAKPHIHNGFESAIYLIKGRVETRYGDGLSRSVVNESGDFIFIPPDVPHQPINLSETEAAVAIVARNDPDEQEHVILLPESGASDD